jgi:hypothetical protein
VAFPQELWKSGATLYQENIRVKQARHEKQAGDKEVTIHQTAHL